MKKITPRTWVVIVAVLAIVAAATLSFRAAAFGTVAVSEDTSSAENEPGWMFVRDDSTTTSYAFVLGTQSYGIGSLYAGPITNSINGSDDKFVAELFLDSVSVADFDGFSYDFMIGEGGDVTSAKQFYVNVYVNIDDSNNYYDCRFDYVASAGSVTSFTKWILHPDMAPTTITKGGDRIESCPAILSRMPEGSHIRAIALNMGDTTGNDDGLDGYFDNVEIVVAGDATTYNFEPVPGDKEECQGSGWENYGFRNQGQCIKYVDKGIDTR